MNPVIEVEGLANFEGTGDGSRDISPQTNSSSQLDGYELLQVSEFQSDSTFEPGNETAIP